MIVDYKLLEVPNNRELQREVKRFIDDGWEPLGGPVFVGMREIIPPGEKKKPLCIGGTWTVYPTERVYAQAIIKRQPESEELAELRARMTAVSEQVSAGLTGVISEREALEGIARLFMANSGPVRVQPGYVHQYDQDPKGE